MYYHLLNKTTLLGSALPLNSTAYRVVPLAISKGSVGAANALEGKKWPLWRTFLS